MVTNMTRGSSEANPLDQEKYKDYMPAMLCYVMLRYAVVAHASIFLLKSGTITCNTYLSCPEMDK
jgi:hypothetical protein